MQQKVRDTENDLNDRRGGRRQPDVKPVSYIHLDVYKRQGRTLLKNHPQSKLPFLFAALLGEAVMVVGYFLYSALLMGEGFAAIQGVTGNLVPVSLHI